MKPSLQAVEHLGRYERLLLAEDLWDEFANETSAESRSTVLDELASRAAWSAAHPGQDKSLAEIAQALGVRL